ncbi:MAG: RNA-binding protein [Planctomycetota bacterium]
MTPVPTSPTQIDPEDLRWLNNRAGDLSMKMYVGNLSFDTTESELESVFAEHGAVQSAVLVMDRETGRPRGFGFVEMGDDDARNAMQALDGANIGGRNIKVNEAKPREDRGGGGGGYRGGRGGGGGGRW